VSDTAALLSAALAAAERGWPVFPLRPGDKRPAFPDHDAARCTGADPRCRTGHTGWQARATTDPGRIRRAWSATPYNVGIATGPAALVVVDLDTPKPGQDPPLTLRETHRVRDGSDMFALLCEQAGVPAPRDTYTVTTGRGGTHLYYRHPHTGPELRNTGGTLGWLIDTRAHGGYVVAAGSTVAGRPYTVAHDTGPARLPGWLAETLHPAPLPPQRPVTVPLAADRHGAYLRSAVTRELARVTGSPPHGHNNALYQAAVALGQLVAGGQLGEDDVTAWLTDAATRVGQRPRETARTIGSGLRTGAKRPRTVAA
jgi:hypothetical protein